MIKIYVTNPYFDDFFSVDKGLEEFMTMFNNQIQTMGYATFKDEKERVVILNPDKLATIEIREEQRHDDWYDYDSDDDYKHY